MSKDQWENPEMIAQAIKKIYKYTEKNIYFLEYLDDPYEIPKKMEIYHIINSANPMSIDTIIQRIISNRETYIEIQKKKEQKLQNYYRTEDFTVKEVILSGEKKSNN